MRSNETRIRAVHAAATAAILTSGYFSNVAHALTIVLNADPGTSAQAIAGFRAAADRWQANFSDNATVTLQIGYATLGGNILAQAGSTDFETDYSTVKAGLIADRASADDFSATATLQSGSAVRMLINYTNNNPNGVGSSAYYTDQNGGANNTTMVITTANARAMGLAVPAGNDANITFSSDVPFDFDPTNGITPGTIDFIGVATHEIGHALGMVSGVDVLDFNSAPGGPYYDDDAFTFLTTADLFRFSNESRSGGLGLIDWTADSRDKFFSVDGGTNKLASFATGVTHGDGSQASHWKDFQGIGVMDPTADYGELLAISDMDRRFYDTVGWNRNFTWKWLAGTSGTWNDGFRWDTDGVPDARVDAVFANAGTYAVSFSANATAKSLLVSAGSVSLAAGTNTLQISQGITVSGGNLTITSGKVQAAGLLNITSGSVTVQGGSLKVAALSIAGTPAVPTAKIDLMGNGLVIDYTGSLGTTLSDTVARIKAGKGTFNAATNSYLYNGLGITSSLAGTNNALAKFNQFAIGAINNVDLIAFNGTGYSTFAGNSVDASSVLIRYTYAGDANLDGKIDSADYSLINRAFAGTIANVGWLSGDFNFDGAINASDYAVIDFGYLKQGAALGADAPTAVPEPGAFAMIGAAAMGLLRRRRRTVS